MLFLSLFSFAYIPKCSRLLRVMFAYCYFSFDSFHHASFCITDHFSLSVSRVLGWLRQWKRLLAEKPEAPAKPAKKKKAKRNNDDFIDDDDDTDDDFEDSRVRCVFV